LPAAVLLILAASPGAGVHASRMASPVTPRLAATVVVIRQGRAEGSPFEVLLLRRSTRMTFVAGAHVFPGGRLDEGDVLADAAACCDGLDAAPRFPHLDAEGERASRVAAVRELVEEAGVLLARRRGSWATTGEAEAVRARLDAGSAFEPAVREGGWRLALDALVPFSRVVTPRYEPRRFDTHFFLAELPAGREARSDEVESDELVWIAPARAMEHGLTGEVVLLPPTWVTLMQLDSFDSVSALLAWAQSRSIAPVEPVLTATTGGRLISFPAAAVLPPGEGTGATSTLRFSFEEGRGWRPVA
jgi:8-oxo-dGTP pyrophosphatase MutT (NUDIX family)